ncbi:uncharacterized protein [Lepeophtheirus salmonis]|uniref:uncharacterized protein isoform X1 n=2 Tax=Lepeophtheirus salmonis TaxID=72036 RepID=UPI001AE5F620|nr:uncharacterized protein LOC121127513 isoform X2 [Lepeophtheirus salmonis]
MSHSLTPIDDSLFPKCSPSITNKVKRKKKKNYLTPQHPPSSSSSSHHRNCRYEDDERKDELVDILVHIDDDLTASPKTESMNKMEESLPHITGHPLNNSSSTSTKPSQMTLDIYGNAFPLPTCSSEASSSSGASSVSSSSKDNRRILPSDLDVKSPLRDSKIEIAGGREIFSQSKTRSGRQKRTIINANKIVPPRQFEEESKTCSSIPLNSAPPRHQVLRETVFSSEIHSIEYHRPLIPLDDGEEELKAPPPPPPPPQDVNVTYDLIDGIFSPPSGLVVRCAEDEPPPTQDLLSHSPTGEIDFVDTLYLGEEASNIDKKQSVMIGGVTIAEYEGSPRRYRPRKFCSPSKTTTASSIRRKVGSSASSSTTSSTSSLAGLRPSLNKLPGFPQRILPPQEETKNLEEIIKIEQHEEEEELLKFEEVPPPQIEKVTTPSTDYDSRYEFSETRKVLDEFFKDCSPPQTHEERGEEFGELDYTLKRRQTTNESYVGHRLASCIDEGGATTNDIVGTLISPSNVNDDLLCTSVVPVVGLSPLDPASSVNSAIPNGYFSTNNSIRGGNIPSPDILSNGGGEGGNRHSLDEQNGLESSRNFTLSPETTDCDSADLESEVSANEGSINSSAARIHLPVLEDGLSSGHASDLDDDIIYSSSGNVLLKKPSSNQQQQHFSEVVMNKDNRRTHYHHHNSNSNHNNNNNGSHQTHPSQLHHHSAKSNVSNNNHINSVVNNAINNHDLLISNNNHHHIHHNQSNNTSISTTSSSTPSSSTNVHIPPSTTITHEPHNGNTRQNELGFVLDSTLNQHTLHHHHKTDSSSSYSNNSHHHVHNPSSNNKLSVAAADESVAAALKDIKKAIQAARVLQSTRIPPPNPPLPSEINSSSCSSSSKPSEELPPTGIIDPWILRQNANPTPPLAEYDPTESSSNHPSNSQQQLEQQQQPSSSGVDLHSIMNMSSTSSCNNSVTGGGSGKEIPVVSSSSSSSAAAAGTGATTPVITSKESMSSSSCISDSSPLGGNNSLQTVSLSNNHSNSVVVVEDEIEEDEVEDDEEDEDVDEEEEEDEEDSESDIGEERVPTPKNKEDDDLDTDQETDRLLGQQYNDDNGYYDTKVWRKTGPRMVDSFNCHPEPSHENDCPACRLQKNEASKKKTSKSKEALSDPKVLIEGVLFRARYLGSTQLVCEGQPTKATRMMQAEEAVSRIKAPDSENQPSTEVDLFISTEKIMVLNTDLKEIMMDHSLRSISYIADIGDILVIMARRRIIPSEGSGEVIGATPKMICHVFESEEAQFIAQSIGQAFQVAYMEFLKANGIEDHSFVKEMDYQEVLNSQEIFGDELAMFAKKELQKEVVVPKTKGEILGVVIVESGWGSMLPTIVLANLSPTGPAARCGHLNIGDQIIAINGISLVGLPLSTCQHYIKNTKNKTAVKLTAVSCAPVVEVKIKRPDTKYQLGFSVQNGVICSLLRGGIAERGGVRVGHRIIEINGQSVVAVPHERIVNLLATSVGEITMKTMPTSMFRLLTGQETPLYI